jgi:Putative Actinobacterial Holin-X, holin superfamily III
MGEAMTVVEQPPTDTAPMSEERVLARIAGELSEEVRQLARLELALARTEVGEAVTNAKKAGVGLGSAGVLGVVAVLFVSFAGAYALAEVLPTWAGFLIVAVLWAVGAAAFFLMGRGHLRAFDPVPHRTIDSLKEDATWLRHRNS